MSEMYYMKYVVCILLILSCSMASALELSDLALFNRCYSHLTKKRINSSHALLKQVKDGSIDPISACFSIFDKAALDSNGNIGVDDADSRAVIKTMTQFHNTYFNERAFKGQNSCQRRVTLDINDELAPALHFTRALLSSSTELSSIMKGTKEVRGVRETPSPVDRGPASEAAFHKYLDTSDVSTPWDVSAAFLGTGDLIGVTDAPSLVLPQVNEEVLNSFGGGVIGSKMYIQRVLGNDVDNRSDGGVRMNRHWSKSVVKDFLCRDLPMIRESDGAPYIDPTSSVSFRTQSACIGCHATMDRMAGAIRGIYRMVPGKDNCNYTDNSRTEHVFFRAPDRPLSDEAWPSKPDRDYYRRPAGGYLYFRSYNGDLIHRKFDSIEQLGEQISQTNDFYVCAAKKYYKYLTGVDVSLADINDPFSPVGLNEEDLKHRNKVISYGLDLKKHQSLSKMLKEMISSPTYRLSDYGIQVGE